MIGARHEEIITVQEIIKGKQVFQRFTHAMLNFPVVCGAHKHIPSNESNSLEKHSSNTRANWYVLPFYVTTKNVVAQWVQLWHITDGLETITLQFFREMNVGG